MNRLEVLWKLITGHLLEVCQHTNLHFRKWGADGLSLLITSAIISDGNVTNQRRRDMVLSTFSEISSIPKIDVRTRQMECVLEVLETCGEKLSSAWPVLLNIIQDRKSQILKLFWRFLRGSKWAKNHLFPIWTGNAWVGRKKIHEDRWVRSVILWKFLVISFI